ncbi:MAG: M48 family metallopeptidase [Arenicella sp.]
MDFFGYQQQARRKSFWLIIGVLLAALAVIVAINVLLLVFLSWEQVGVSMAYQDSSGLGGLFSQETIARHSNTLLASSAVVASLMGISSTGKIMSLRDGGGQVARQLGGDLVSAGHHDPLRRRLYNVVEEIAIASGMPVPEVYVLEEEAGINAFAAGYTQSDAAVAVTRGALEAFDRAELQGVIAHEFSHIHNGDTRINIRLMGVVFGILVLSIIGRKLLMSNRRVRHSSNNKGVSVIVLAGFGLMIVGYSGLFFARWLKASISRQREYLADASAVQFTRDPEGISSALKKIAVHGHKSYLEADSEEVSHMLFGNGQKPNFFVSKMFATHPPLLERIQRFEPRFKQSDLLEFGKKLRSKEKHEEAKRAEAEYKKESQPPRKKGFDFNNILQDIGHPSLEQIILAGAIADSFPSVIEKSAHSVEWASEVVLLALLSANDSLRQRQLEIIAKELGQWSDQKMHHLLTSCDALKVEQRLPLLEMAFPQIKHRPTVEIEKLLATSRKIVQIDHRIDTFEYLLFKQLELQIVDQARPNKVQLHGNKTLDKHKSAAIVVISVLAIHGGESVATAKKAFQKAVGELGWENAELVASKEWPKKLDKALSELNTLKIQEKKRLVITLVNLIMFDEEVLIQEHELLRAICACLHIPLPVLA